MQVIFLIEITEFLTLLFLHGCIPVLNIFGKTLKHHNTFVLTYSDGLEQKTNVHGLVA